MSWVTTLGEEIGSGLSTVAHWIGDGIKSLLGIGNGSSQATASAISSGLSDLIGKIGGFLSDIGNGILGDIGGVINELSGVINHVITPIQSAVNGIEGIVQQFNDQLVKPIADIVQTTQTEYNALLKALHDDLQGGLQNLVKLPGDILDAIHSEDATLARAQQELATHQADIASKSIEAPLVHSVGAPLGSMAKQFAGPVFTEVQDAVFADSIKLNESITTDDYLKQLRYIEETMVNPKGFLGPVIKAMWELLKVGDAIIAQTMQQVKEIEQRAKQRLPIDLLGVGDVIEARRRGLLTAEDTATELSKHGLDDTRQKVLYDLAQFLFSPKDAVGLLSRQIIDPGQFNELMDQNNLDAGQSAALIKLMQHILGPGDIVAAQARGYITGELADQMRSAAMVPEETYSVIAELEKVLIDPKILVALAGRSAARDAGLLKATLSSDPPEEVTKQFKRVQAETGADRLAWLAHWKIPDVAWWVDAYFRELITLTELQDAFVINNIPKELWDSVVEVERELPPVWMVPDVVASGVWGKDKAVPTLMKLGFSEDDATVLYDYGMSKSKSAKAATAADLQKLSLGNAETMYKDGIIDGALYVQILKDHGFSDDAAALTLDLVQFNMDMAARRTAAQDIVDRANLGEVTYTEARSMLFSIGLKQVEVENWLHTLYKTQQSRAKLPTEAQLNQLYKKKHIDQSTWLSTMVLLGYSETWANLLFELI